MLTGRAERPRLTVHSGTADDHPVPANDQWDLKADHAIREDVGYLVVGGRQARDTDERPWILVSVNPGWHAVSNPHERILKGQPAGDGALNLHAYEAFREGYFPTWHDEVIANHRPRGAGWWNKALRFLRGLNGHLEPIAANALHQQANVLGWELWPFHSTRDGLSSTHAPEVRAFALASLEAAIRFQGAKGVIAASKVAAELATALCAKGTLIQRGSAAIADPDFPDAPPSKCIRVDTYRHRASGGTLCVIDRQLFSNWGTPRREHSRALAGYIRADFETLAESCSPTAPQVTTIAPAHAAPHPVSLVALDQNPAGPILISVPVNQNAFLDLPDDVDEIFERTVGYWVAAPEGSHVTTIRRALSEGRRAFVFSRNARRFMRVFEIVAAEQADVPDGFLHHGNLPFAKVKPLELGYDKDHAAPFATLYQGTIENGTLQRRVRYHTAAETPDEALAAQPYHTNVHFGPSPSLCTFGDLSDPRVIELLATKSSF